MLTTGNSIPDSQTDLSSSAAGRAGFRWGRTVALLAAAVVCAGAAEPGQQDASPINRGYLVSQTNQTPSANGQTQTRGQANADQNLTPNIDRKKQIGDASAKLLELATELKTEVDKTNKDTLSLGVIRKADEIEKLAHNAKEKMKLSAGAS
jgi:hypothetical protein